MRRGERKKFVCHGSWWREREEIEGKDAQEMGSFLLSLQAGRRTFATGWLDIRSNYATD
jgi:hypothetical protein